jgi:Asp/Glu/hydantoin racemase
VRNEPFPVGAAMRLLLINPNISFEISELIHAEAKRTASAGTEIEVLTAPFGVAYIETRFEALIGAYAVAEMAAEHHARFDAIVVAAFGDPGLPGLREALAIPVTGLTEAALATASLLGDRFSIVAISQRIRAWYRETVRFCGFEQRLASIRGLDERLDRFESIQRDQGERLIELSQRCVDEDGADVIILAGAPLAGLARSVRDRIPVPAVDGVSSAVRHAESLVALQPGTATRGSFAMPPSKPNRGLSPALTRLLTQ